MKVHFIGIGGIGVSALAKYHLVKGHQVSGSDLVTSEITEQLENQGAKIFIGKHKKENLSKDIEVVVYSPAIKEDNPELKEARKRGLKIMSYPEVLGILTKKYFTIAVSGSHGKSTITAMIALILIKAGLDPTVILGTKLKEFGDSIHSTSSGLTPSHAEGSNFRAGKSQYLVIEADEHFASFLNYWPKIVVLSNIEREHLDYYKNLKNILKTYKKYVSHLKEDGTLVFNKDCGNVCQVAKKIRNKKFYSIKQKESARIKKILKIPGRFNISNALAALAVARVLRIPDNISFKALSKYRGAWRRFEIIDARSGNKKITIVSDYGHHPTKVRVTLKAAREKFKNKKIWLVFQPHQYQRTYYLFDDFVKVLKNAPVDNLIITDIFDVAGREEKRIKKAVSSQKLVKAINDKKTICIATINETADYLKKNLRGREVVIIMGAGDIYKLVSYFTK